MGWEEDADVMRKERFFAIGLLFFIIIFTICDVVEDLGEGSTVSHVIGEVFVIGLCLIACVYLWRRVIGTWQNTAATINQQLLTVREDAMKWKEAHRILSQGLSQAIENQLDEWGLSTAEKEITFLLMKGLSFKEISEIRQTSEHTIRQQAGTVYRKSSLDGRSQLSAFFLEDLLTLESGPRARER
jgi:DNA-binding CsgD family transcriptional regulator